MYKFLCLWHCLCIEISMSFHIYSRINAPSLAYKTGIILSVCALLRSNFCFQFYRIITATVSNNFFFPFDKFPQYVWTCTKSSVYWNRVKLINVFGTFSASYFINITKQMRKISFIYYNSVSYNIFWPCGLCAIFSTHKCTACVTTGGAHKYHCLSNGNLKNDVFARRQPCKK
jgi:hypothetical protein